jgi:methylthioxylose transferase
MVSAGLASVAGLRRTLAGVPAGVRGWWAGGDRTPVGSIRDLRDRWLRGDRRAVAGVLLPCGFLLAMLAADLSGMSKAETERIWLPFTLWLPATAALLPRRDHRAWLAAQAVVALLVNHLLLTGW